MRRYRVSATIGVVLTDEVWSVDHVDARFNTFARIEALCDALEHAVAEAGLAEHVRIADYETVLGVPVPVTSEDDAMVPTGDPDKETSK